MSTDFRNLDGTGVVIADSFQAGSGATPLGSSFLVSFSVPGGAAAADYDGSIVVPFAWKVASVRERHQTAGTDASAVTLMVKKVPSGTAKASGTDILASGINLKATADTNQSGTLHATAANYTGAAGDAIGLVPTGTLTSVDGVTVTVELQRV